MHQDLLENGRLSFESERVSDRETLETIKSCYEQTKFVLDPHSAIGVAAAKRSIDRAGLHIHHISLSTAHPAKFSEASISKSRYFLPSSLLFHERRAAWQRWRILGKR